MSPNRPSDDLPIEFLAAYVDGELDETGCARVEAWLAGHPEALDSLFEQREFSPSNRDLWEMTEPPMPSACQWQAVYRGIENRLVRPPMPARPRKRITWYLAPFAAISGLAAVLLIFVAALNRDGRTVVRNQPSQATPVAIDDDEDAVFKVATADDVEIIQLPEEASDLIVVGRHPMSDTPLVLASTADVDIFNLGPDDQGRMPSVELIAGPNTPMVVAQPPRR